MKPYELMNRYGLDIEVSPVIDTGDESAFELYYVKTTKLENNIKAMLEGLKTVTSLEQFIDIDGYCDVSGLSLETIFNQVGLVPSSGDLTVEAEKGIQVIRGHIVPTYSESVGNVFQHAQLARKTCAEAFDRIDTLSRSTNLGRHIDAYSGERFVTPITGHDSDHMDDTTLDNIFNNTLTERRVIDANVKSLETLYFKAGMGEPDDELLKKVLVISSDLNLAVEMVHEAMLLVERYSL